MKEHLKKLTGESIVYGLGQAAGRGLQMLLVPIFTRVFTPASYGVVDLLGLVGAIAALVVVMGTDAALARFFYEASDREARRTMVSTSALWRVIACAALAGALFVFAPVFSRFALNSPDYAKYIRLTALTIPFTAFFLFQNDVLRVTFQPVKYVTLNLLNTALVGGLSILFVVALKRDVAGVLYAKLAGDAITAAAGFVLIRHQLGARFERPLLRRMLGYGLPLIPVAVAYWAIQYADRWMLSRFADLAAVGVYAVAVKMGAAMMLVVQAFQLAWGPFAFARARDPGAARLFSRVLTLYVGVGAAVALFLGLVAPEALAILVPEPYRAAALPGALLAFAAVAHGAFYIAALGVNLALRNDVLAWTSGAAAAITVGLDLLLVRRFGLTGVAFATLTGFTLSAALLYSWAQRIHYIPYRGLRAFVLFLCALAALVGGLEAHAALGPGAASLAVRAAVLVAFAGLAALLTLRGHEPAPEPVAGPRDAAEPTTLPGEFS